MITVKHSVYIAAKIIEDQAGNLTIHTDNTVSLDPETVQSALSRKHKLRWVTLQKNGWFILPCEVIADEREIYQEYGG